MSYRLLKDHEVIDNKGDIYFHPKIIIEEFLEDIKLWTSNYLNDKPYETVRDYWKEREKKWEKRLNE